MPTEAETRLRRVRVLEISEIEDRSPPVGHEFYGNQHVAGSSDAITQIMDHNKNLNAAKSYAANDNQTHGKEIHTLARPSHAAFHDPQRRQVEDAIGKHLASRGPSLLSFHPEHKSTTIWHGGKMAAHVSPAKLRDGSPAIRVQKESSGRNIIIRPGEHVGDRVALLMGKST